GEPSAESGARATVHDEPVYGCDAAADAELAQRADKRGRTGDALVVQHHVRDDGRFYGSAGRGSGRGQVWNSGGVADVGGALARGDAVLLDAARAPRGRSGDYRSVELRFCLPLGMR